VRLLVEDGVVVNAKDDFGKTAPRQAASEGHEAVVRLLVELGVDVNVGQYWGTALHQAASEGHEAVVRLLVELGADVNVKNNIGETALQLWEGKRRWCGCWSSVERTSTRRTILGRRR